MTRLVERMLILFIGIAIIYTVILPAAELTADRFNQTSACIQNVEDCHGH